MLSFKNFLVEEKNTHMTHLEDVILNQGDKPSAGFSNQGAGDIEAKYKGKVYEKRNV